MAEFISALKALSKYTAMLYDARITFSLALAPAFMLFAPQRYVDFVLRSPKIPDFLNPWIGLLFLFPISFWVTDRLCRLWEAITGVFRKPPPSEMDGW